MNAIEIEKTLNISLPSEYIKFIDSSIPDVKTIVLKLDEEDIEIESMLNFNENSKYNIIKVFKEERELFSDDFVPFAVTKYGDYICFDYSNGRLKEPNIVYLNYELSIVEYDERLTHISNDFSEFLTMLVFKK